MSVGAPAAAPAPAVGRRGLPPPPHGHSAPAVVRAARDVAPTGADGTATGRVQRAPSTAIPHAAPAASPPRAAGDATAAAPSRCGGGGDAARHRPHRQQRSDPHQGGETRPHRALKTAVWRHCVGAPARLPRPREMVDAPLPRAAPPTPTYAPAARPLNGAPAALPNPTRNHRRSCRRPARAIGPDTV
eukprot:TRINITY_DN14408_c0_g1_i1.p2 TRINITY_DN14408_c0_g1~~TRINITY_DN14408_c0_g1_i1.p2  ORF type:complete len:188 (-),score=12.76 TRINITY_DN14408_c0_g1_i1:328-891(-)